MKRIISLTESDLTNIVKMVIKENKLKNSLIDMIKKEGWDSAAELVGGIDNLKRLSGFESPMEFLNLFNDLDVVKSKEKSDLTLYRHEKGNNMMIHNRKNDYIYINYYVIWSFLEKGFKLNYSETQEVTKEWLGEVYNLRGVTPGQMISQNLLLLGEVYNLRGVTPIQNHIQDRLVLGEVYNLRGVTPSTSLIYGKSW